ncbi:enoyl-CoA hydratase/isomerase family protein [Nemania abortiva]|nr:enoyl-CoA hydratase/isomerase family protein [Nemania abortiva]
MEDFILLFKDLSADDSVYRIITTGYGNSFYTSMDSKEDLFTSATGRYTVLCDFAAIKTCPKPTSLLLTVRCSAGASAWTPSAAYFCLSEVELGLCPATVSKYSTKPQVLYDAGIIHAPVSDTDSLDKALEAFLEGMRYAAPQAAALTKTLAREAASGGDIDLDGAAGEVFKFAPQSEFSYGITQFKCGIKHIAWEDLGDDDGVA